ncbi:alpha/beta-hydrolase [Mollisia scopiformis]|uniref:Alpha/beta-hydrolase n=1 Tax=Mollisia scopiformis TaxID=149040 RepID=A0A194X7C3_MOLSC|nr:alpha/beta-hydrolase [Mollisia scopiformis]KUJ16075.1 alpha/beta-hydrolase [Mollisia scopiformis]
MAHIFQVETDDGISWYVEQSGTGPHILLVPSGEGDCSVYAKAASHLSSHFTVTTFDLPCFSRTIAPHSAVAAETLTPYKIADQIVSLMDKLSISTASVFGSSSGGNIGFAMLQKYDQRVEKLLVHEVPLHVLGDLKSWVDQPTSEDPKTVATCQHIFAHAMNEDLAAWEGLGAEYHKRLHTNYVTWYRNYSPVVEKLLWDKEELKKKKERIFWSVGGLMPLSWFWENVVLATETGVKLEVLNSKHFPQVSIPGELAEYIKKCHL